MSEKVQPKLSLLSSPLNIKQKPPEQNTTITTTTNNNNNNHDHIMVTIQQMSEKEQADA